MGFLSWMFGSEKALNRISELKKKATSLKKDNPEKAVEILRKVESLEKKLSLPSISTRLRIATVLYEADRFDDALEILTKEYADARKWVIGKREFDKADKMYLERMKTYKFSGEKIKDFEKKRDGGENPDFERNLFCKEIYFKLRVCYERSKQYDKAIPFALADAYAKFENECHSMYTDETEIDYKTVEKLLKKAGKPDSMEQIKAIAEKYAKKPDSTKCWRMLDELEALNL